MRKNGLASSLTLKNKLGYGLGDAGACMTFALMSSIFTRYCLNILEVNGVVLAGFLLVWNVWDAVNDPMMGALLDKMFARHKNPKGKFRPWILRSTPLLAITAIALWTLPTLFDGVAMLAVLFICKILYEGCYTMFNIPYGSLLSAMADTDAERASLSSFRSAFSGVGSMVPVVLFPVILEVFGDNAAGYRMGILVCAVLGFILCMLHYGWTRERHTAQENSVKAEDIHITDILVVFRKNRAFLALGIHAICICCSQTFFSTISTNMYGDVMGSIGMMGAANGILYPLSIVFLIFAPAISRKMGTEKMIRRSLILGILMFAVLFAVYLTMDLNVWVYIIWTAVAESLVNLSALMQWGMLGEAIDYNEYLTGKRTEGSIYGTFNLCRRIGNTLASSACVLALGWIGYDAGLAAQTSGAITGIKFLGIMMPALFAVGSWAAFRFVWDITPTVREKITAAKAKVEE